jgi:hypothetical protein
MARFFAPVLAIRMDDGTEHTVTAFNPDMLEWERERARSKYVDDDKFTMMTFLAWSASKRAKINELSWPEFKDHCLGVTSDEVADVDPTSPAPGAG